MKKRTRQRIAKVFAFIVVLIMIFQVVLPLFNSGVINTQTTAANVTTDSIPANIDVTPIVSAQTDSTSGATVTTTTSPETSVVTTTPETATK